MLPFRSTGLLLILLILHSVLAHNGHAITKQASQYPQQQNAMKSLEEEEFDCDEEPINPSNSNWDFEMECEDADPTQMNPDEWECEEFEEFDCVEEPDSPENKVSALPGTSVTTSIIATPSSIPTTASSPGDYDILPRLSGSSPSSTSSIGPSSTAGPVSSGSRLSMGSFVTYVSLGLGVILL